MKYSPSIYKRILKFQKDEITGHFLYKKMAGIIKHPRNKKIFLEISHAELCHYQEWRDFTKTEVSPDRIKIGLYVLLYFLLGETFILKYLEQNERFGREELSEITGAIPEAAEIVRQEIKHEEYLIQMIDEERLQYVGSVVLGLNDALVELTGTIAGMTFALASTKLVALVAIITGGAATLSMGASNYLAERATQSSKAVKSSIYTGMAYLITVILLTLPYLLLPDAFYGLAFLIMLILVVGIIFAFNFYVSVVQSTRFFPRFLEMAAISLGVAALSFVIGIAAKYILGVDLN